jgi:hypothetical protein
MTYSSGGLIQATDYNGFVSTTASANLNATLSFYGAANVATTSASATVSASQWSTLFGNIANLAAHQGTAVTSRTPYPVSGNTITAVANVNTDLTNIYSNRYNAASSGTQYTTLTSGSPSKTTTTGGGATAWTITFTHTLTFANTTATTNFFNAGGIVRIQFGKSSTGSDVDPDWNTFIGANGAGGVVAAAVNFTGDATSKTINGATYTGTTKTGGTGTPTTLATTIGYNQLTGTPQTIYKQFDVTSPYTGDYVQINASVSGAVITFTTTWYDSGDANPGANTAISGGTATTGNPITWGTAPTTFVSYIPPESNYITNTWGTPTIAVTVA